MLLLMGFLVGAIVVAALALTNEAYTKNEDPIFHALKGQSHAPLGSPQPARANMLDSPATQSRAAADMPKVASLSELLPRLEAKVAATPNDAELQILLARTYLELDQRTKVEALLNKLAQWSPQNEHLPFLRAKMLMQSDITSDLRTAISLFEESTYRRPAAAHLARLYQGQILVRLGERTQAIKVWRDFLTTLPADDERRMLLEDELEKIQDRSNSS